jgi:hypothetical protein
MSDTFKRISAVPRLETTVRLDLGDCDTALRGAVFDVWVTPTRAHLAQFAEYAVWLDTEPKRQQNERDKIQDIAERAEYDRVMAEKLECEMNERLDAWLAEAWRNIPAEEVAQIREHLQENAPSVWDWLYKNTLRAMRDYRENLTKN